MLPYGLCIWSTGVGPTQFVLRRVHFAPDLSHAELLCTASQPLPAQSPTSGRPCKLVFPLYLELPVQPAVCQDAARTLGGG